MNPSCSPQMCPHPAGAVRCPARCPTSQTRHIPPSSQLNRLRFPTSLWNCSKKPIKLLQEAGGVPPTLIINPIAHGPCSFTLLPTAALSAKQCPVFCSCECMWLISAAQLTGLLMESTCLPISYCRVRGPSSPMGPWAMIRTVRASRPPLFWS